MPQVICRAEVGAASPVSGPKMGGMIFGTRHQLLIDEPRIPPTMSRFPQADGKPERLPEVPERALPGSDGLEQISTLLPRMQKGTYSWTAKFPPLT